MVEWKMLDDSDDDDSEEDDFEDEDSNEESQKSESYPEFDSFTYPTARGFRNSGINPFLSQEPIDNLEEGLQDTPAQTQQNTNVETSEVDYALNTAPNYASAAEYYDSTGYDTIAKPRQATQMDISGGALIANEREVTAQNSQRDFNFSAWNQRSMGGYPKARGEDMDRYIPPPSKIDSDEGGLPIFRRDRRRKF